jgi:hypothetical protein
MSLGFAMSEIVGSIGIELKLEREQFDADLQSLEALQNKALKFSPILNTGDISKQMGQFGDRSFKVTAIVDDKQLTALNKHLDLKQRHFAQVSGYFKSAALTPKVDLTGIKALDGQLDSIRSNIESLSGSSVSVGVDVDSSAIDAALGKLQSLQTRAAQSVRVASSGGTDTTQTEEDITKAIERGFKKASANSPAKALMDGLFKSVTAPVRLAFDVSKGALSATIQGMVLGATQEISKSLGGGVSRALEQSLSGVGGTGAIGEALGETLVGGVLQGVKNLDQLPALVASQISGLPDILEAISAQMGVSLSIPTAPFKSAAAAAKVEIEKEIGSLRKASTAVGAVGADAIGSDRAREYGLALKSDAEKQKARRTPAARNQAAKEKQQALRELEDAAKLKVSEEELVRKQERIASARANLDKAEAKAPGSATVEMSTDRLKNAYKTKKSIIESNSSVAAQADPEKFAEIDEELKGILKEKDQVDRAKSLAKVANAQLERAERELEEALIRGYSPASVKNKIAARDQASEARDKAEARLPTAEKESDINARAETVLEKRGKFFESKTDPAQLKEVEAEIAEAKSDYAALVQDFKTLKAAEKELKAAEEDYSKSVKNNERISKAKVRVDTARANLDALQDKTPVAYRRAIKNVLGVEVPEDKRPELKVDEAKLKKEKAASLYNPHTNRIYVTQEQYDRIYADAQTSAQSQTLEHEIVHGGQYDFGSAKGLQAKADNTSVTPLVKPSKAQVKEYQEFLNRGYSEEDLALEFDAEFRANESQKKNNKVAPSRALGAQVKAVNAIDSAKTSVAGADSAIDKALQKADQVGAATPKTRAYAANIKKQNDDLLKILISRAALIDSFADLSEEELSAAMTDINFAASKLETNRILAGQLFKGVTKPEIVEEKSRPKRQKPLPGARDEDIDANVDKFIADMDRNIDVPKKQFEDTYLKGDLWETPIAPDNSTTGYLNVQAGTVQPPPSRLEIAKERAKSAAVGAAAKAQEGMAWLSSREYEIDTDQLRDRAVGAANVVGRVAGAVSGGASAVAGGGRSVFRKLQAAGASTSSALAVAGENQTAQGIVRAGASVAFALGAAAKAGWSLAKGLESIVLDIMPAGRMVKGGIQQIALPAAGFAAATHFLPGGAVAAQGLQQMVGGVVGPMMGTGTNAVAGGAADFAMSAFPHAMGIASGVSGAATGAIHAIGGAATEMVIQAGTVILGGKALQVGAGLAANGAAGVVKSALPSDENRMALPPAAEAPKPLTLPAAKDVEEPKQKLALPEKAEPMLVEAVVAEPAKKKALSLERPEGSIPVVATRKFEDEPEAPKSAKPKDSSKKKSASSAAKEPTTITVEAVPVSVAPEPQKPSVPVVESPIYSLAPEPVRVKPKAGVAPPAPEPEVDKADAFIKFTKNDIAGKLGESYAAAKAAFASGDLEAAASHIAGIRQAADSAQSDIGGFVDSLGDAAKMGTEVGNKLNGYKGTIGRYRGLATTLERKINKAQAAKPADSGLPPELDDTSASLVKEAVVGLAGFAGSQMIHGNVGGAIGGTVATVGARVGATVAGAGYDAYQGLKSDEVFKAASALDKFRMILEATGSKLSAKDVQDALGSELSGDLIGNLIGNAIPGMGGAAAGLVATPQLVKLREKISSRLSPGESAAPELNEGLARKSGDAVTGELSAKQQEVLKWAQGLLDQAIAQAENIDNLGEALTQQLGGFSERANLESDLSGLDVDKEIGKTPGRPMASTLRPTPESSKKLTQSTKSGKRNPAKTRRKSGLKPQLAG